MDIDTLIQDDADAGRFSVNRRVMTSQEVFDLEQARIFDRSWLYVGHEMEIPEPGDFRRRSAAGRPLIFVRGNDGAVRVLYNTCTHRGAEVCRQDSGRASVFQCFYHAWSYDNKGALVGVPDEAGYGENFAKGDFGLKSPPRVEQYRGMYFVAFDSQIADLRTHLGRACDVIDLTWDSAEVLGGWTILAGSAQYTIRANWKLLIENSFDGYHFASVHQTYFQYLVWRAQLDGKTFERAFDTGASGATALPNGHANVRFISPGRGIANPSPVWDESTNREVARIKAENIARFGEARGTEMCEYSRQLLIYPNVVFQDTSSGFRLRLVNPVAPDRVDVLQWELAPRNESPALHAARMELSLAFLGPGGLATPDDVEALESCQRGFGAREVAWSDVSRGMGRKPAVTDELQMRSFWRQWYAHIRGQYGPVETGDLAPAASGVSLTGAQ
jgi:p-cumate 2,3-dioxygenase subunit alpha